MKDNTESFIFFQQYYDNREVLETLDRNNDSVVPTRRVFIIAVALGGFTYV